MKLEKEILKENGLTNIDELIDSQFGKPEHQNVKCSGKKPVLM